MMEEEIQVSAAYVKKIAGVRNEEDEDGGERMSFNNAVSASS